MNIDAEKIMENKKSKKKKNKKALSLLGKLFTILFLDFIGQILIIPLAILIVMIYFYLK